MLYLFFSFIEIESDYLIVHIIYFMKNFCQLMSVY